VSQTENKNITQINKKETNKRKQQQTDLYKCNKSKEGEIKLPESW